MQHDESVVNGAGFKPRIRSSFVENVWVLSQSKAMHGVTLNSDSNLSIGNECGVNGCQVVCLLSCDN